MKPRGQWQEPRPILERRGPNVKVVGQDAIRQPAGILHPTSWPLFPKAASARGRTPHRPPLRSPGTDRESHSYAIVAPPLAILAASWLSSERTARLGWGLAFVLLSIGVFPELFSRIDRNLGLWWDPLMMIFVSGIVASRILRRQPLFSDDPPLAKA